MSFNKEKLKKVLKTNRIIDQELIKKSENLEKNLAKIGIEIKPEYRLSPPFGSAKVYFNSKEI